MTQKQSLFGPGNEKPFALAYPKLTISADFKTHTEDFVVDEELPFSLTGEGEHVWLYIQKTASNTDWVAKQLAHFAQVKHRQVSYAGLKDRQAVCRQWFSVHMPGRVELDWQSLHNDEFCVLKQHRHQKKLQRGALKQNRFVIRLRNVQGDLEKLAQRCQLISQQGVPNYFGEQRFGHNMENLTRALAMFEGKPRRLPRHKRSLYLSAARSWLFNAMLSERIHRDCWNKRLAGDVFMLAGKRACFTDEAEANDGSEIIDARLASGEIHPTAALWGEGESMATRQCVELEAQVAEQHAAFAHGLVTARLEQQRRATRLIPQNLSGERQGNDYVLQFGLGAGSYATTVLRELLTVNTGQYSAQ